MRTLDNKTISSVLIRTVSLRPDITVMADWVLKKQLSVLGLFAIPQFDYTELRKVDWALKLNYLSWDSLPSDNLTTLNTGNQPLCQG